MKTSTLLLIGAGGVIAYLLWKQKQAATGSATAAVSGPAQSGAAVSGPAQSGLAAGAAVPDTVVVDEIDYVPVGWGPSWVSIMPGGGRRGGHRHGGGGHRGGRH